MTYCLVMAGCSGSTILTLSEYATVFWDKGQQTAYIIDSPLCYICNNSHPPLSASQNMLRNANTIQVTRTLLIPFIAGLFIDDTNRVVNDRMISEVGKIWKRLWPKVLSWYLPRGTDNTM
jgi:hypothetical protein